MGNSKQTSVPDQMDSTSSVCSSPLIRTKFTGADSSIEYSARPRERESEEQNPETVNWEDRPSTPTILGYEVMEERAKFTVSIDCTSVEDGRLINLSSKLVSWYFNFLNLKFKQFLPFKLSYCSEFLLK